MDKEYPINVPEGAILINPKDHNVSSWTSLRDDDELLNKAFVCEESGKLFRIVRSELLFYRKHHLPLPTLHPDIRHLRRTFRQPEKKLHVRKCDKTGEAIVSVYPTDVPFEVYSEKSYKDELF